MLLRQIKKNHNPRVGFLGLDNLEYPEPLNFLDLLEPRPAVEIVQDEQPVQIAGYFLVDSIECLELVPDAADACA
jgi:hypothetical protein